MKVKIKKSLLKRRKPGYKVNKATKFTPEAMAKFEEFEEVVLKAQEEERKRREKLVHDITYEYICTHYTSMDIINAFESEETFDDFMNTLTENVGKVLYEKNIF